MTLSILPSLALSVLFFIAPRGGDPSETESCPPSENASAAAISSPAQPDLRCERFVLEVPVQRRAGADPSEPLPARPIGFVEWRRRVEPSGSVLLERDTWFQEDGLRLRQTERSIPAKNGEGLEPVKMIWREQLGVQEDGRPGLSRSLVYSASRKPGEWTLLDRFAGHSDRTALRLPESGPAFPLALVEALRERREISGTRFSALSKSIEVVELSERSENGDLRLCELRRPDGSLVLQLTFQGDEIQSFRFQDKGVLARRVGEVEWRRLKDRLNTSQ